MQQSNIEIFETVPASRGARRVRSPWLASAALCLALLSLTACSGTGGDESAEALEEREADARAEEKGNRRD